MFVYQGLVIDQNEEGYYCDALNLGYCDTIEEMKAEIDDKIFEHDQFYQIIPSDTPCLPEPWWTLQ